jgi:hypothetical protein
MAHLPCVLVMSDNCCTAQEEVTQQASDALLDLVLSQQQMIENQLAFVKTRVAPTAADVTATNGTQKYCPAQTMNI